mmetsp:Transcript_115137/g.215538  ORF Transcript_115137/g.215538 Transcript_115137/m.215538 type:complete len:116 (-) Transcript_115137:250-597(-)
MCSRTCLWVHEFTAKRSGYLAFCAAIRRAKLHRSTLQSLKCDTRQKASHAMCVLQTSQTSPVVHSRSRSNASLHRWTQKERVASSTWIFSEWPRLLTVESWQHKVSLITRSCQET